MVAVVLNFFCWDWLVGLLVVLGIAYIVVCMHRFIIVDCIVCELGLFVFVWL